MFRFIIEYFDEIKKKVSFCKGVIKAESYENAINRLIDYIGKENFIGIEKLYELDDILEDDNIINDIIN